MPTIVEIATGSPDFSVLVSALQYVDSNVDGSALVATLSDPDANVTVFAPTNAAFGALATSLGFTGDAGDGSAVTAFLVDTLPAETIRDVITYHVAGGRLDSTDISALQTIPTLNGASIGIDLPTFVDAEPDQLDPSLVTADVAADNGIVHVIDRVLLPFDLPGNDAPTIAGFVVANANGFDQNGADFDILLAAVQTAGLVETLSDPNVDLTVLAPTDSAFTSLAGALGYTMTDEAGALGYIVDALTLLGRGDPLPLLTTVLTYHVAPESLQSSQLIAAGSTTTLAGAPVTVTAGTMGVTLGDLDPDLADAPVVAADLQASNGIVHAIGGVLLPADLLPTNGANDVAFVIGKNAPDVVVTGADNDWVFGKGGNDRIVGQGGDDVLLAGDGADTLNGGDGNDFLLGGSTAADLSDVIYGGAGNDTADGGAGNDLIFGMGGDDLILGAHGTDTLVGGEGNDTVSGGALSDEIFGGAGDDFINGGFGSDRLNGGAGADTFFHAGVTGHGSDWIQDYDAAAGDVLLFGGSATAADFVLHGAQTSGSGDPAIDEAFISFRPTGQILWALVDGDGQASINIRIAATGETFDLLA